MSSEYYILNIHFLMYLQILHSMQSISEEGCINLFSLSSFEHLRDVLSSKAIN